jgi:Tol biopolymer transport system component
MNPLNLPCRGLALALFSCCSLALAQQPQVVSLDSAGGPGNGGSDSSSMTPDGRFVAFDSAASNLVPNDTNNYADVFVRDTLLSTTTRVSISSTGQEANGDSFYPVLSSSGHRVLFVSTATNLAPFVQGSNEPYRLFVHDLQSGVTELASVDDQGNTPPVNSSIAATLSADGRHVLFFVNTSGTGSSPGVWYVRDLLAQTTTRLVTNDLTVSSNWQYLQGQFLGDGRWVAFTRGHSTLTGPVSRVLIIDRDHDQNGVLDEPGTITRSLIEPTRETPVVRLLSSSRNGRFFTYQAATFGLSPSSGLWLHDRDPDGDGVFDQPSSAPDKRVARKFVLDFGATRLPQISNDGRYVVFVDHTPVGAVSTRVALVRDMQMETTFIQGVTASTGDPAPIVYTPTISGDGLTILVTTESALVAGDVNGQYDVYSIPHEATNCEPPVFYGDVNGNSVFAFGAIIDLLGSTRISDDNFTLQVQYVPNGPGQFFYGPEQVSTPFGDGIRLVGAGQHGVFRLPIIQGVGHFATYQMHFGLPPANAGPGHIIPGSTWNFQYMFRDPGAGTFGFNTSGAVQVTFSP